ncbi:hypothetical protein VTK56DRAFT_3091 [Thermocarpiscus australiensis]
MRGIMSSRSLVPLQLSSNKLVQSILSTGEEGVSLHSRREPTVTNILSVLTYEEKHGGKDWLTLHGAIASTIYRIAYNRFHTLPHTSWPDSQ